LFELYFSIKLFHQICYSVVLRTTECGAELTLPTADLFDRALTRTAEQIAGAKVVADFKLAA
jgi:hypothetical protein